MHVDKTIRGAKAQDAKKSKTKKGGAATFRVSSANQRSSAPTVSSPHTVAPLGALIAVQAVDQVQNDRRRAVSKAREVLDVLDELKLSLLTGERSDVQLARLSQVISELQPPNDGQGLEDAIQAVLLRARVELAKRGLLKTSDISR